MGVLTLRALGARDRSAALFVINTAARWYREFLSAQELHDPEMTASQWDEEARRMTWYGAFASGALLGVMGLERQGGVALLRHAYVLPKCQRQGIGTALREHLERQAGAVSKIIVGTYALNYKARRSLEKAGYRLVEDSRAVLRAYYSIPEDRLNSSVAYEKRPAAPEGMP